MYRRRGGVSRPPPLEKGLRNSYRIEMHVHSPVFQGQLIEKKIRSITFIVWVLGRVEKNAKRKVKKMLKIFFLFKTNIKVSHVSTSIFQGL